MYDKIVVIGILLSLIYTELTGLSSGGLIVPGYLAITINNPSRILFTIVVSLITYILIKVFSEFMIIYGRRRFALSICLAIVVNTILINYFFTGSLGSIGYIVPGIITNSWFKDGIVISLISLSILTLMLVSLMIILGPGL